jgi:formate dehydrogenase major subunit
VRRPSGLPPTRRGRDGELAIRTKLTELPLARQLTIDRLGLGRAAQSKRSEQLAPRTRGAQMTQSICPYCAVGCSQRVYHRDGDVIQIEGDPDSPISRGRLCPKGAASEQLVNNPFREYRVKYRRPYGTEWEELPLDEAMDMIADRVIETRERTWEEEGESEDGERMTLKRTLGFAHLGGATLDNEENYLIKKLFTAMGAVQIENQARI